MFLYFFNEILHCFGHDSNENPDNVVVFKMFPEVPISLLHLVGFAKIQGVRCWCILYFYFFLYSFFSFLVKKHTKHKENLFIQLRKLSFYTPRKKEKKEKGGNKLYCHRLNFEGMSLLPNNIPWLSIYTAYIIENKHISATQHHHKKSTISRAIYKD